MVETHQALPPLQQIPLSPFVLIKEVFVKLGHVQRQMFKARDFVVQTGVAVLLAEASLALPESTLFALNKALMLS